MVVDGVDLWRYGNQFRHAREYIYIDKWDRYMYYTQKMYWNSMEKMLIIDSQMNV